MTCKIILRALAILLVSASVQGIEINDALLNKLPLEVGKGLTTVQSAKENNYEFKSYEEAAVFLKRCQLMKSELADVKDDAWDGSASELKALINDPKLAGLCEIDLKQIECFKFLNPKDLKVGYLSVSALHQLLEIKQKLESDDSLKTMFGQMFESRKDFMIKTLIKSAADDVEVLFGEKQRGIFNFDYQSDCEISVIKPVCKLVRRTKQDKVSAFSRDITDFIEILTSPEMKEKLDMHIAKSGVTLEGLKESCRLIRPNMLPLKTLDAYLDAKIVDDRTIQEYCDEDERFCFYFALNRLCSSPPPS